MRRLLTLVVVVVVGSGCGFSKAGNDMGDGGGSGGSGGGGDMATSSGAGCGNGAPVLVIAVASVDGSKSSAGSAHQYAVSGSGVTSCGPTLTASNTLDSTPTAIAWLPPASVAYGQTGIVEGATCDLLVDGTTLPTLSYPSALAVGAAQ